MKCLEIKNLDIAYGKKQIIFGFDFELDECQIGCLLGPSGCGKTTVLRSIAGFDGALFKGASSFAQTLCGAWLTSTAKKKEMFEGSSGRICSTGNSHVDIRVG